MKIAPHLLQRRERSYRQLSRMQLGVLEPFAIRTGDHMPKLALVEKALPLDKITPKALTSTKLDALCEEYLGVCAKFDQIEARKKALAKDLQEKWHKRHGPKIETDEYLSTDVGSKNTHISKELLLKLGVKATVIAKATKSTPYSYVRVTKKKPVPEELA